MKYTMITLVLLSVWSMGLAWVNPDGSAVRAGDPVRGRLLFQRRCTGCHAMDGDREGPRLAGVFGRKAASVPGFQYSAGLRKSGIVWDDATLDKWLTDPQQVAPDALMDFNVPHAQERKDLIAYLRRSSAM